MIRKIALTGILGAILLSGLGIKSCVTATKLKSDVMREPTKLKVHIVTDMAASQKGGTAVVLLHGWGAPGDDLVPIARMLVKPNMRIFVPEAPLPHPAGGRAWWSLDIDNLPHSTGNETLLPTDPPIEILQARTAVQGLLQEIQSDYAPTLLAVAGFSQGGMLAADLALQGNPPIDRAVVLSGSLLIHTVQAMRASHLRKPIFFVSHGAHDRIVPFRYGRELKDALEKQGYAVSWHPFSGDHEIPPSTIQSMQRFLQGEPL